MDEQSKEKEFLNNVIEIINNQLEIERDDLQQLFDSWIGSKEELWMRVDSKKLHISNLETSKDNPYFARIDFTIEEDTAKHKIYIGKHGVMLDNDVVVTDWRAPISSLYYNADIGNVSYEAPEGIIKGNLSLKR